MKAGVVVNPVAGMGGAVGLKGTDDRVEEARSRGAEPRAGESARRALEALTQADASVEVAAASEDMGEHAAEEAGFSPEVVDAGGRLYGTDAEDTRRAVQELVDRDVDLLLFVGGDGTAADVAAALDQAEAKTPALGVPAGVKIYSAVFAETPEDAGRIAAEYTETEARDVVDVDEEAFRGDDVVLGTTGVLDVPVEPGVQTRKSQADGDVEAAAQGFVDEVEDDVTYVLGPGGTMAMVKRELGVEPTLLGVDVYRDGETVARDASASEVEEELGSRNVVVVSPIGGQGFVLGRGNQQITPEVLKRSELEIVASSEKLRGLEALKVDTGDPELDEELRGHARVRVGRREHEVVPLE